jgi:Uma2 family endonuclease
MDDMTSAAILAHPGPWTEDEYFALALAESNERIELIDGDLFVHGAPTPQHNDIAAHLWTLLLGPARAAGLRAHLAIAVRLQPGRIVIPDLTLTSDPDRTRNLKEAPEVPFVCEVLSPRTATHDRVKKMGFYAAAGVRWYLLIEQASVTLRLYRLHGDLYAEHSITHFGEKLHLTDPVIASIDTSELLPD